MCSSDLGTQELGGTAKPDVQGSTCTSNCATAPAVASLIPDYARNAHGNLADQSRGVGGLRGADTQPAATKAPVSTGKSPIQPANTAQAATNLAALSTASGSADNTISSTAHPRTLWRITIKEPSTRLDALEVLAPKFASHTM